jgi:3-oxoacyl-[acyl-carrier protein] reductase
MREIHGMSVLVTGGGSGIGEGIARHFVARGARVTITGRRPDKLDGVARELGPACRAVAGDVTLAADRAAMLAAAVAHGGGLDLLVNNAGNMYRQAVGEYTEAALREAFDTNVIAGMMLSSVAVPLLATSKGAIVFMGSVHNRRAYPGATPYAATKAAIEGLTRVMAAELGPQQIRVSCVVPGAVPSELNVRAGFGTPEDAAERYGRLAPSHVLGRVGTPAEIAEAVEYLARAEWVTGAVLEVDGGLGLAAS